MLMNKCLYTTPIPMQYLTVLDIPGQVELMSTLMVPVNVGQVK